MKRIKLGHVLAAVVGTIAVLNTLSALSMPVPDRKAAPGLMVAWLALLALHAALYRFGDRIRRRWGIWAYAVAQAMKAGEIPRRNVDLAAASAIGVVLQAATYKVYGRFTGGLSAHHRFFSDAAWAVLAIKER